MEGFFKKGDVGREMNMHFPPHHFCQKSERDSWMIYRGHVAPKSFSKRWDYFYASLERSETWLFILTPLPPALQHLYQSDDL